MTFEQILQVENLPDYDALYDTTRADEPPVTPRPWREQLEELLAKDQGPTMLAWRSSC